MVTGCPLRRVIWCGSLVSSSSILMNNHEALRLVAIKTHAILSVARRDDIVPEG
jgi:hypothetical protein